MAIGSSAQRREAKQRGMVRSLQIVDFGSEGPCQHPASSRESKYPIFKDPGSKSHTLLGFWDQSP